MEGREEGEDVTSKIPLTDPWFEAEFYGFAAEHSFRRLPSIDGAQGIFLWCPCAYGDDKRAHGLLVPFSNPRNAPPVPAGHGPASSSGGKRPRWTMSGSALSDLTLKPSVDVGGGKDKASCWHGFITNGQVIR